jgi:hypothetical protein
MEQSSVRGGLISTTPASSASHLHASVKLMFWYLITKSIVPPDAPHTKHRQVFLLTLNDKLA